ncbi:MAG TPA: hypothetical protein VF824_06840 [Thermoanaerobaculia bacterium]|jgi:hypothetical protein
MLPIVTLTAAALLSLSTDASLRLYNPHAEAVEARVACGAELRVAQVAPGDVADLALPCATPSVDAPLPLAAFSADDTTQRIVSNACDAVALEAPRFGCRLGTATVAVSASSDGAYDWSVEGATIAGGAGTNRIVLSLGNGPTAHVTLRVNGCASEAVIAIREPLAIDTLTMPPGAAADQPVIINWTYAAGAEPATQLLTGTDFDAPIVLGGAVRSYSWTPTSGGAKHVELRASYAPSIGTRGGGRRRSVGQTQGGAANCATAVRAADLDVSGCGVKTPRITAPASVDAGSLFTASTDVSLGQTVAWHVDGGTIRSGASTRSIEVKADDIATNVRLRVDITAGAGCSARATRDITVVPHAVCTTAAPTASVALASHDCFKATVVATFTGTPPFRGRWSDGKSFETSETTLSHDFTVTGGYSIEDFRDASCRGSVTKTARIDNFAPTAVLSAIGGSCTNGKVVARFTGRPPFSGNWSYGGAFTTNEKELAYPGTLREGGLYISNLADADCTLGLAESRSLYIRQPPKATFIKDVFCSTTRENAIGVLMSSEPPLTVYWADGAVSKVTTNEATAIVWRSYNTTSYSEDVRMVRATDYDCELTIPQPVAHVSYRPQPRIVHDDVSPLAACDGRGTMTLGPMNPKAVVTWTLESGTIVSGQGTPSITYTTTVTEYLHPARVSVVATYPDGECNFNNTDSWKYYSRPSIKATVQTSGTTIRPGGSINVTLQSTSSSFEVFLWDITDAARRADFNGFSCGGGRCTGTLHDTHGAGIFTLRVSYANGCGQLEKIDIPMTVTQ